MRPAPRTSGIFSELTIVNDRIRQDRRPGVKGRVPGGQRRMAVPPVQVRETKIQVGQSHADGELSDGEWSRAKIFLFQRIHAGKQLRGPQRHVRLTPAFGGTESFAQQQQRRIKHPLALGVAAQRGEAVWPRIRIKPWPLMQSIEIFDHHRRVMDDSAILQFQCRNFSKRIRRGVLFRRRPCERCGSGLSARSRRSRSSFCGHKVNAAASVTSSSACTFTNAAAWTRLQARYGQTRYRLERHHELD